MTEVELQRTSGTTSLKNWSSKAYSFSDLRDWMNVGLDNGQDKTYSPAFALKEIVVEVKLYSNEDSLISGRLTVT